MDLVATILVCMCAVGLGTIMLTAIVGLALSLYELIKNNKE